jgi:hypothetical protein
MQILVTFQKINFKCSAHAERMQIILYADPNPLVGTVLPDCICMRVVPWIGLGKDINRYRFLIV